MSDTTLKLYYSANCLYCQNVITALDSYNVSCELLPLSNHKEEVQKLADGVVPVLVSGDDVIMGSPSIVSYFSANLEKLQAIHYEHHNQLSLYYTAASPYCQSVIAGLDQYALDCVLLPQSAYLKEVQALSLGETPALVSAGSVILDAKNIVAYLDEELADHEKLQAAIEKPVQAKRNMSDRDLRVRFMGASFLLVYGVISGLEPFNAFDREQDFWAENIFAWMLGTIPQPWNYLLVVLALFLFYTSYKRYCPLYERLQINKNKTF
ncbi:MAG: glutathione S-transferase N-terminal domain-containing protein [Mariprofundaceae bacterium]|nr:glutathione S-transferase N-terminal domain-containing protein [Mariprofundaceae bacterium]